MIHPLHLILNIFLSPGVDIEGLADKMRRGELRQDCICRINEAVAANWTAESD